MGRGFGWTINSNLFNLTQSGVVMIDADALKTSAIECSQALDCDLILINSAMSPGVDTDLRKILRNRKKLADKAILLLVTEGGLADVAYRCARDLQGTYESLSICIPGWCKSAGTLMAISAHELIIGDRGELGPLDVQIAVRDEIGDRNSGLILQSALETMRDEAFKLFETHMMGIKGRSGNLVTFRTAADLAATLAVGLMKPIFEQIDPIRLGDDARSQKIGYEYGTRLNLVSRNLQDDNALEQLIYGYPSHSFVIDRTEAAHLFRNVKPLDGILERVVECLGDVAHTPIQNSCVTFLNGELASEEAANDGDDPATEAGGDSPEEPIATLVARFGAAD